MQTFQYPSRWSQVCYWSQSCSHRLEEQLEYVGSLPHQAWCVYMLYVCTIHVCTRTDTFNTIWGRNSDPHFQNRSPEVWEVSESLSGHSWVIRTAVESRRPSVGACALAPCSYCPAAGNNVYSYAQHNPRWAPNQKEAIFSRHMAIFILHVETKQNLFSIYFWGRVHELN